MNTQIPILKKSAIFAAATALTLFTAQQTSAAGTGQLGILDTSGNNPETELEWGIGETYHLIFVTTSTTDALSTSIADYNAFVQNDANAQVGAFANMGNVNWFALGSTTTTDAIDNAVITAPVMNAWDSVAIASDSTDFWDFQFTANQTDTAGNLRNAWTGSTGGGVADGGDELGATDDVARRHWSGWTDWVASNNNQPTDSLQYMIGISEELTVVPEASAALLIGLAGLALLRRRR